MPTCHSTPLSCQSTRCRRDRTRPVENGDAVPIRTGLTGDPPDLAAGVPSSCRLGHYLIGLRAPGMQISPSCPAFKVPLGYRRLDKPCLYIDSPSSSVRPGMFYPLHLTAICRNKCIVKVMQCFEPRVAKRRGPDILPALLSITGASDQGYKGRH